MNFVVAFALVSFTAAPVPKADPLQEAKQNFQGEWKVMDVVHEGNPQDQESLVKATFVIKGDKMEINFQGRSEVVAFTLDPKTDPPSIDLQESGKEKVIKGIYQLEKTKLTICFGMHDTERPKVFSSAQMSNTGLIVLERVKK